jgi:hypothetical protein
MNKEAATMSAHIIEPVSLRDADPEACAVLDSLAQGTRQGTGFLCLYGGTAEGPGGVLEFQQAIMNDLCLEERHRELAYLKTAMLADCKLLHRQPHGCRQKRWAQRCADWRHGQFCL